jgi:hypothetical protein
MQKFWLFTVSIIACVLNSLQLSNAFLTIQPRQYDVRPDLIHKSHLGWTSNDVEETLRDESASLRNQAQNLLDEAERLRQEIKRQQHHQYRQLKPLLSAVNSTISENNEVKSPGEITTRMTNSISLPWSVECQGDDEGEDYRLYVDVGREEGTWMDARWGASGKRIPFALDVKLLSRELADDESMAVKNMVKNNRMEKKSSKVFALKTAPYARLRDGFDRMQCYGGAYHMDMANNGRYTLRLMVEVEGTKADQDYMYGDVSIPKGYLYFSLPCFGGRIDQLSTKEGPVTVRQIGWHTGWRREENRILGVFRAKTIKDAQRKDPY